MLLRALSKCLLNTDRLGGSTTSLGSLFQGLTTLLVKKVLPNIKSKPPLVQFWTIPTCPITGYQTSAPPSPRLLLRKPKRAMRSPVSLFSLWFPLQILTFPSIYFLVSYLCQRVPDLISYPNIQSLVLQLSVDNLWKVSFFGVNYPTIHCV